MILFLALALSMAEEPTDEMKRDIMALELFLQDKVDHEKICPKVCWEQPELDVYKEKLKSQLPEECKQQ
tara:strand:- start:259 stop:465 length:207 start_codon:yes stop_codon:yes gene_type:complete